MLGFQQLSSSEAVRAAIAEFDRVGRDSFLSKYRFGRARRYFLEYGGRRYDSKAIAGAAYGYQFPSRGPLRRGGFRGGERTVQRKLEEMGFTIRVQPSK
jgi:putative restriction endonuclease